MVICLSSRFKLVDLLMQNLVLNDFWLTELINVGVEDLGSEEHLGGNHRVFVWQVELSAEHSSFVGSTLGTSNLDEEVSVIVFTWLSVDSNNYSEQINYNIRKYGWLLKCFLLLQMK